MDGLPPARKRWSCALKLIVILSAAAGTIMSARAGRGTFMGGGRVFMFFTIQSNILIALISAADFCLLQRNRPAGSAWYTVKLVGTVSITLTGVVFAVLLAPLLGNAAWNVQNTLTHLVVPAASAADFLVTASDTDIKKKSTVYVIIPPLLYVIYAGIGYVNGWEFVTGQKYPYFFLNWGSPAGAFGFTDRLPYMGCVWWILILCAFLIAAGRCYLAAAEKIGKMLLKRKN